MVFDQDIPTFDPRVSSDPVAERMRELLFNGLTRINEQSAPVPDLAARIEASADRRIFTFHLKRGVKFHNDRPLSSLDVKYTFETMLAPGFVSDKKAGLLHSRLEIEATDPATVVFRCSEPFPDFLKVVAQIGIIPEGTTAKQATEPIGTGPYKLVRVTKAAEIILTAHRDFFAGPPSTENLRIKIRPAQQQ